MVPSWLIMVASPHMGFGDPCVYIQAHAYNRRCKMKRSFGITTGRGIRWALGTIPFLLILLVGSLGGIAFAQGDGVADHVVISEVQIVGATSTEEFVELYNPLSSPVDMTGWRLSRRTAGGTESNLLTTFPTCTIPAYGYFLIAHPSVYTETRDAAYSTAQAIASNNTVILYSDAGLIVVDRVGMGSATISETATISNPVAGGSIERKAQSTSTAETMGPGGADDVRGNGYDSNDNSQDFVLRDSPEPQNSSSASETPFGPPVTVTVSAFPLTIPADGTSGATITATVSDTVGCVADGTVVTFTTNLGSFPSDPYTNTTASGVATATLTSEKTADTAHVTATADSASGGVDVIFAEVYKLFMPLIVKNFTAM